MDEDLSEHDEIIAEAREKYTVHNCDQCEFRKSCINEFDSDECKKLRQSIMLGFGIEDGYFTKLLDRLEAAHKRELGATCEKSSQVGNAAATCNTLNTSPTENVNSERVIYNAAKIRFVNIDDIYINPQNVEAVYYGNYRIKIRTISGTTFDVSDRGNYKTALKEIVNEFQGEDNAGK